MKIKNYFVGLLLIMVVVLGISNVVSAQRARVTSGNFMAENCAGVTAPQYFFQNATQTGICYVSGAIQIVNGGITSFALTDANNVSVPFVLSFAGDTRFNITTKYASWPSGSMTYATDGSRNQSFSSAGNGCLAVLINGAWTC
jgi:hypothetical protein